MPNFGSKRLVGLAAGLVIATGAIAVVLARSGPGAQVGEEADHRSSAGHWPTVRKAQRLLDSGRPDQAFDAVMNIRDQEPGAAEAMTIAGISLFRLGDPIGARRALELALNLNPEQAEAARALAALCLDMGDATRGLFALKLAAEAAPDDPRPWSDMGRVHLDLGEFDQAVAAFEDALRRNPLNDEIRLGLIVGMLNGNQADAATARVEESLVRRPDDPKFLGLAARHALALGQEDRALELADRALKRDPNADEALLARGRARHSSGDQERALADVERFLELRPNNLSGLQLLAQIEARLGLTERASRTAERHRAAYDRADRMARLTEHVAEHPDDPEPRWQMGQLALEGGSIELARRCFAAALQLDPSFGPAREALADLEGNGASEPGNGSPPSSAVVRSPRSGEG